MKELFRIQDNTEGFFKDRGSKFFAYAFPISDAEEVNSLLEEVKPKHKNANHFCFAFQIGTGDSAKVRVNDDGEPSGSAGLPILNQIKSAELTDIFLVVAREFGGTKLGVSGLINAYKIAAQEALNKATKVRKISYCTFELKFGFDIHGEVMSLLSRHQLEIKTQEFGDSIRFVIQVEASEIAETIALFDSFAENIEINILD